MARGWRLQSQVVTEGQDLLDLVAQVQKTSPLQHFGTSRLLDRISTTVSQCRVSEICGNDLEQFFNGYLYLHSDALI